MIENEGQRLERGSRAREGKEGISDSDGNQESPGSWQAREDREASRRVKVIWCVCAGMGGVGGHAWGMMLMEGLKAR